MPNCYIRIAPWPRDPFEILTILGPRFPRLFEQPTPLAIGVHVALAAACPDVTAEEIRLFLAWWTGTRLYLASLLPTGAVRRNLAGAATEPVSRDDRVIAAARLLITLDEDAVAAARLRAVPQDEDVFAAIREIAQSPAVRAPRPTGAGS